MKHFKKTIIPIFTAIGLLILILDARTAVAGAQEGVWLCIRTLIPSLFPFFVISGYFCRVYSEIDLPFLKPVLRLCGMPNGTQSLLVIGALGGYPVGAKAIADAYTEGRIHINTAKRMLGFCSNAGPAFVFGIIGGMFENRFASWVLLLILILSAIITGWLLPGDRTVMTSAQIAKKSSGFSEIFQGSIKATASVCGWVILFRVILSILKRWFLWFLPDTIQIILTGILELSNGCLALNGISNDGLRFVISAGILSFGGLCVFMQTLAVTGTLGAGLYFPGKILQCLISLVLSSIAQFGLFSAERRVQLAIVIAPAVILLVYLVVSKLQHYKKTVAIPRQLMYNTGNRL